MDTLPAMRVDCAKYIPSLKRLKEGGGRWIAPYYKYATIHKGNCQISPEASRGKPPCDSFLFLLRRSTDSSPSSMVHYHSKSRSSISIPPWPDSFICSSHGPSANVQNTFFYLYVLFMTIRDYLRSHLLFTTISDYSDFL